MNGNWRANQTAILLGMIASFIAFNAGGVQAQPAPD